LHWIFDPEAGGELEAVIQFELSGDEARRHLIAIENGMADFAKASQNSPYLTIQTPSGIWRQVSSGKIDGAAAFSKGLYKVTGDFSLLVRLSELFPK